MDTCEERSQHTGLSIHHRYHGHILSIFKPSQVSKVLPLFLPQKGQNKMFCRNECLSWNEQETSHALHYLHLAGHQYERRAFTNENV